MDIKKLDKVFSEYIRRRDADEYGRVKCCTCPNTFHWSEMDAGHFVRRGNLSVRFHEMNCHAQCKECNQFKYGMEAEHYVYIANRYNEGTPLHLIQLGRSGVKFMQFEIDEMTEKYKLKIRDL